MSIGSRLRQDTSRMSSSGSEDDMGMDVMGARSFVHRASPRPSPSFSRSRLSDAGMGSMRQPSNELFGSLLGSYEESILNGRMSTTPSRPVDFVAEIGVFGQGKCKPSLKCPPHVILPCPATYYLTPQDNVPSPYGSFICYFLSFNKKKKIIYFLVGLIDLEHGIVNSENPGLMRLPAKGMLQLVTQKKEGRTKETNHFVDHQKPKQNRCQGIPDLVRFQRHAQWNQDVFAAKEVLDFLKTQTQQ